MPRGYSHLFDQTSLNKLTATSIIKGEVDYDKFQTNGHRCRGRCI